MNNLNLAEIKLSNRYK